MIEYEKIGFKAGLEVHQQLDAGKLFCHCPGYLRQDEPDFIVKRRLHKVAGETGEIDVAVEHEAGLDREFVYQGYDDSTCLVELDESPPELINENALDEVIKIALLLNCEIYPVVQVMRKTVIDGSNTSGFQRSVLIAHSGFLETSAGKIGIDSVALEEDAARIVSRDSGKSVYRLDRLGIPLVEIGTSAELKNAEQVKEAALKIGEILRACKVKRGIGTIRQDVNVSIKGHERVEIKGFQEPRMMVKTIELEIERQIAELKEKKKTGEVRNALADGRTEFLRPIPGMARMYPETDLPLLRIGRDRINRLKKNLPRLKKDIREELKKKGVNEELIALLVSDNDNVDEFTTLMRVYNNDSNLVAKMVSLWRNEIAVKMKKGIDEVSKVLNERVLERILEEFVKGALDKGDIKKVMEDVVKGLDVEKAVRIEKIGHDKLEEEIARIVGEKPGLSANAYMGLVMAKMKGKIDARKAMEILKRLAEGR